MKSCGVTIVLVMLAANVALAQAPPPLAAQKPLYPDVEPVRTCESMTSVSLPNTTIDSAAVDQGDERFLPRAGSRRR